MTRWVHFPMWRPIWLVFLGFALITLSPKTKQAQQVAVETIPPFPQILRKSSHFSIFSPLKTYCLVGVAYKKKPLNKLPFGFSLFEAQSYSIPPLPTLQHFKILINPFMLGSMWRQSWWHYTIFNLSFLLSLLLSRGWAFGFHFLPRKHMQSMDRWKGRRGFFNWRSEVVFWSPPWERTSLTLLLSWIRGSKIPVGSSTSEAFLGACADVDFLVQSPKISSSTGPLISYSSLLCCVFFFVIYLCD